MSKPGLARTSSLISEVLGELDLAERTFPPFNSAHEGYAVLLEEVDELWGEVKASPPINRRPEQLRKKAVQVAAMALRFIRDVCDK